MHQPRWSGGYNVMVRGLASRLIEIPGVLAVTLGGSRATGTHTADSDWDFGLYYRGALDTDAIRAFGWIGNVFEPGEWGRIVNGGAWLVLDGQRVDLIYRDLDEVERWTDAAELGRFRIEREVGYVAGIATYVLAGELALGEVLRGDLPRPAFSDALQQSAPRVWNRVAAGALHFAAVHTERGDDIAAAANLCQAVLAAAQARLAAAGQWALNEKGIITRAGFAEAQEALDHLDLRTATAEIRRLLDLESWAGEQ